MPKTAMEQNSMISQSKLLLLSQELLEAQEAQVEVELVSNVNKKVIWQEIVLIQVMEEPIKVIEGLEDQDLVISVRKKVIWQETVLMLSRLW